MVISIFLKFGMVKLFKNWHNVAGVKNLLPRVKIFEYINILLFLIDILIKKLSIFFSP